MAADYLQAVCSLCGLGVYKAESLYNTQPFDYYCSCCGRTTVRYVRCENDTQGWVTLPAPFEHGWNDDGR